MNAYDRVRNCRMLEVPIVTRPARTVWPLVVTLFAVGTMWLLVAVGP